MLNLQQLALLGVVTSGTHWLVARAEITRFAWSRARGRLARLLACAGCSGWWLGLGARLCGLHVVDGLGTVESLLLHGVVGVWITPVFEAALLWGLERTAIPLDDAAGPVPQGELSEGPDARID